MIAVRYAQGIRPNMPLIGWSMSKSITHALIGRAFQEGLLDVGKPPKMPKWSDPQDPRQRINLDQLLRMNSGLAFEESTGTLNSDLVRMLTQEADMAGFAASQPPSAKNREKVELFIRNHQYPQPDPETRHRCRSALAELSQASIIRATRDDDCSSRKRQQRNLGGLIPGVGQRTRWARFVQLHLDQGRCNGKQLLPATWVR